MAKRIKLKMSLEDIVRSKADANQVLSSFNDIYSAMSERDNVSYFSSLLGVATENNHVELVKLLLTDKRTDLNSSFDFVPSPLFIAIRSGNIKLFQLFLQSNPHFDLIKTHDLTLPSCDFRSFKMSVFEYACFNDSKEIVTRILKYVQKQYDERVKRNSSTTAISAITPVAINPPATFTDIPTTSSASIPSVPVSRNAFYLTRYLDHQARQRAQGFLPLYPITPTLADFNRTERDTTTVPTAPLNSSFSPLDLFLVNTDPSRFILIPLPYIQSNPWWHAKRMLHVVVKLCCRNPFSRCNFSLPQIVKLVLESGADVNVQDENGFTPLYILCTEVQRLQYPNSEKVCIRKSMIFDEKSMILKAAEMLLAGGAQVKGTLKGNPLDALLNELHETCEELLKPVSETKLCLFRLSLVTSLINVLLKNGGKMIPLNTGAIPGPNNGSIPGPNTGSIPGPNTGAIPGPNTGAIPGPNAGATSGLNTEAISGHCLVFFVAGIVAEILRSQVSTEDGLMDLLAETYRCFVLAGNDAANESVFLDDYIATQEFQRSLESVALYSSQPNKSNKLMFHVVNTLSGSQMNQIRSRYNLKQATLSSVPGPPTSALNEAVSCVLEWTERLPTLFSLEHLARQTVVRQLTYKCLQDGSSLKLPELMSDYVLLLRN